MVVRTVSGALYEYTRKNEDGSTFKGERLVLLGNEETYAVVFNGLLIESINEQLGNPAGRNDIYEDRNGRPYIPFGRFHLIDPEVERNDDGAILVGFKSVKTATQSNLFASRAAAIATQQRQEQEQEQERKEAPPPPAGAKRASPRRR